MRGIVMRSFYGSAGWSTVAAAAIAMGVMVGAGGTAAPAIAKEAKPAPTAKVSNSPEFTKVAGPFQKTFNAFTATKGKVADAEFKASATALVPELAKLEGSVKSPLDRLIYGDWQRQIGGYAGDTVLQGKGLQNMLDSGQLQPTQSLQVSSILGQTAYVAKDYPTAIKVLAPLMSVAAIDDPVPQMLAESYANVGQPKQGLDALKAAIAARTAAHAPVPEEWYTRGNRIAYVAKLTAESNEWALLLVAAYPSPLNWLGAAQLVRNGSSNFTSQDELDISRLMDQSGALKLAPATVSREYVAYLQAIDARRFPGEAVRIAEQGVALGALKSDDTFLKDTRSLARARLTADKASLAGLAREANASPSGKVSMAAADTYLSYGDAAKADELYGTALTKGGIDADKDRVLIRQGIAQIDESKFADAKATLAKVGGPRAAIARLWSIYADQKAAGK